MSAAGIFCVRLLHYQTSSIEDLAHSRPRADELAIRAPGSSGVSGSHLKPRIHRILHTVSIRPLGVLGKCLLVTCLGASVALPVVAGAGWHTYTTEVGGLKRIILDGQIAIMMNTATTMRVRRFGAPESILLVSGEALFEAAHSLRRPLYITAANTLFVSRGATFSVRIRRLERPLPYLTFNGSNPHPSS